MKDSITEYFTNEQDYPDFDLKGAVDRFCQAIRCKTSNYKDHSLTGSYIPHRECHIQPDWLLVYYQTETELYLYRTGTHSDLFGL